MTTEPLPGGVSADATTEVPYRFGDYTVVRFPNAAAAGAAGRRDDSLDPPAAPPHRLDWAAAVASQESWWLEVRTGDDRAPRTTGFSVAVIPTRALPGHRLLRLERLRFAADPGAAEAAVRYLVDLARHDGRTVHLSVDAFFADAAEQSRARVVLERAGLQQRADMRMYQHTVRIDLTPDPGTMLAAVHPTARRHIRAIARRPVRIRSVDDVTLAPRLAAILAETFDRTSGEPAPLPWAALVDYSRRHPNHARLVGLERTDRDGADALIAFALGINHGDHAEYAAAGSVRPSDIRLPLGYALAWDLMCWARAAGARWFDFGGVTQEPRVGDARSGIRQFKLMFGTDIVPVREEWVLVPRPLRGAWIRGVAAVARVLSRGKP